MKTPTHRLLGTAVNRNDDVHEPLRIRPDDQLDYDFRPIDKSRARRQDAA